MPYYTPLISYMSIHRHLVIKPCAKISNMLKGLNVTVTNLATVFELKIIIFVLNYLTVLVYTKTIIHLSVGG